mmetsp:Transcript_8377/g.30991  ORF Transcript_8377/g.30991 Transcript_8377/m.30991 type:complete len:253 (+) Transcript_8377:629-1387(+)
MLPLSMLRNSVIAFWVGLQCGRDDRLTSLFLSDNHLPLSKISDDAFRSFSSVNFIGTESSSDCTADSVVVVVNTRRTLEVKSCCCLNRRHQDQDHHAPALNSADRRMALKRAVACCCCFCHHCTLAEQVRTTETCAALEELLMIACSKVRPRIEVYHHDGPDQHHHGGMDLRHHNRLDLHHYGGQDRIMVDQNTVVLRRTLQRSVDDVAMDSLHCTALHELPKPDDMPDSTPHPNQTSMSATTCATLVLWDV